MAAGRPRPADVRFTSAPPPPSPAPRRPIAVRNGALAVIATALAIFLLREMQDVVIPAGPERVCSSTRSIRSWIASRAGCRGRWPRSSRCWRRWRSWRRWRWSCATRRWRWWTGCRRPPRSCEPSCAHRCDRRTTRWTRCRRRPGRSRRPRRWRPAPRPPPRGVMRVQVEQPGFRVGDYVLSGTLGLLSLAGPGADGALPDLLPAALGRSLQAQARRDQPDVHEEADHGADPRGHRGPDRALPAGADLHERRRGRGDVAGARLVGLRAGGVLGAGVRRPELGALLRAR